ncbi:MAG TPA: hypothetical protein VJ991_08235, partial [Balneolales bacterium]|nr:hypothetical protein [Balneolales bacterium]
RRGKPMTKTAGPSSQEKLSKSYWKTWYYLGFWTKATRTNARPAGFVAFPLMVAIAAPLFPGKNVFNAYPLSEKKEKRLLCPNL